MEVLVAMMIASGITLLALNLYGTLNRSFIPFWKSATGLSAESIHLKGLMDQLNTVESVSALKNGNSEVISFWSSTGKRVLQLRFGNDKSDPAWINGLSILQHETLISAGKPFPGSPVEGRIHLLTDGKWISLPLKGSQNHEN